ICRTRSGSLLTASVTSSRPTVASAATGKGLPVERPKASRTTQGNVARMRNTYISQRVAGPKKTKNNRRVGDGPRAYGGHGAGQSANAQRDAAGVAPPPAD